MKKRNAPRENSSRSPRFGAWALVCLVALFVAPALAQKKPNRINLQEPAEVEGTGENGDANPPVIELEADVIEGEKKLPAIFLEFESHAPTLDSVIYQRADFNDGANQKVKIPLKFQPLKRGK